APLNLLSRNRQATERGPELEAFALAGQGQVRVALDQRRGGDRFACSRSRRRRVVAAEQLTDAGDSREIADAVVDLGLPRGESAAARRQPHVRFLTVVAADRSRPGCGLVEH